ARGHRADDDPAAGTLGQQVGLAGKQLQDSTPDGAETGDGDFQRRFHYGDPDNLCETPEPPRNGRLRAGPFYRPNVNFSTAFRRKPRRPSPSDNSRTAASSRCAFRAAP